MDSVYFLYYSASSTRINFEPQNWGRTFSVKLLINIEKVHRSCKVLKAGGDCQHQYLMQHKSEGICHIRLSIPFLFTATVGLLSMLAAVHSKAIIIPPRASIFRPRYKFQPQNECFSVTEAGQISIIMLWWKKVEFWTVASKFFAIATALRKKHSLKLVWSCGHRLFFLKIKLKNPNETSRIITRGKATRLFAESLFICAINYASDQTALRKKWNWKLEQIVSNPIGRVEQMSSSIILYLEFFLAFGRNAKRCFHKSWRMCIRFFWEAFARIIFVNGGGVLDNLLSVNGLRWNIISKVFNLREQAGVRDFFIKGY